MLGPVDASGLGSSQDPELAHTDRKTPESGARVGALLALARRRALNGQIEPAWDACRAAAEQARVAGDAAALADAATTLTTAARTSVADDVHRLCLEALAALHDQDSERRLRAQLEATRSPWGRPTGDFVRVPDPSARFLELLGEHENRTHVDHVQRRLELGDEAVSLGHAAASGVYVASGLMWRMTALAQLGHRADLEADLVALSALVAAGQHQWAERLDLVRAALRLLDGRFDDCRSIVAGRPDFLALVMRSRVAVLSGHGLDEVEREVRVALDGAPYFARGWHALLLVALERRDEAHSLWRAISPHVLDLPERAPEWLIATIGHACLAVSFEDVSTARVVQGQLAPYAHLHATAGADTPSYGPVALHLGRLEMLLGQRSQAEQHFAAAIRAAEGTHDLPSSAMAHLELARAVTSRGRSDALQAEAARIATAIGMGPLAEELSTLGARLSDGRYDPLSRREADIAALVADGASNRDIAGRLQLSERTVENHVRHIMQKIDQTSRASVAAWYVRESTTSRPTR